MPDSSFALPSVADIQFSVMRVFAAVLVCVSRQLIAGSIRVILSDMANAAAMGPAPVRERMRDPIGLGPGPVICLRNWDKYPRAYFARLATCETRGEIYFDLIPPKDGWGGWIHPAHRICFPFTSPCCVI